MKIHFLTISLCFLCFNAAISQEMEWQKTIGGSGGDWLYCLEQTSDGGYMLGGYSSSGISGDKTEASMGILDCWIIKTDAGGNIQWQNTIGGSAYDYLYSMQQTSDGGYILGGYSNSNISGDKTENSMGNEDYWIIKTDGSGNIQWQNTIGGDSSDLLFSIQQTADGGYILGGYSRSDISGDKTENRIGNYDYWIVKTDASGNIQWQNTIGGSADDRLNSVKQTADGGYIIGGTSNSNISGDKTENKVGFNDYWIVKTDGSGNIQWQNTIGGLHYEYFTTIQQTPDGGYILGGYSDSGLGGDKTEQCLIGYDYWILKTDATGNIQWQNVIGGNGHDYLASIQQTTDGGYLLGGHSMSFITGDKTEMNFGGWDYWAVKTNSAGNVEWENSIGGDVGDYLECVKQTSDGNYILGGFSSSNSSGEKIEDSNGGNDFWVMKLTDKFNLITGALYYDFNSNNQWDAGEPPVKNKRIKEMSRNRFTFTSRNGFYSLALLDSGNFTVIPAPANYFSASPPAQNVFFSGIQQKDSLNDFVFQPAGVYNDLCIHLTRLGGLRAGRQAAYMITYENLGNTVLNGTVIFFPDPHLNFVWSPVTPTSVTPDSIVWNVGTLNPFQTGNIYVLVNVSFGTPAGTVITSTSRIEPIAGDADLFCNYSSSEGIVVASCDPNEIFVDRDTILTTELSNPPYLDYTIYFQNTGNDTAFTVKIINPIDTTKADLETFEFIASSHPVDIAYKIWEKNLEFSFDNILLPDSNVNEPGSHGFFRYRVKAKTTLGIQDTIQSTAFIYFDFNQPVMTNTAMTQIELPTGVEEAAEGSGRSQLVMYPNPVKQELSINCYSLIREKAELKIFDLFGREIYKSTINNRQSAIKIDVSGFSKGIYFVELQSGASVLRGKFLKD